MIPGHRVDSTLAQTMASAMKMTLRLLTAGVLIMYVTAALMDKYPGLGDEVASLLTGTYPDLLPGLEAVLTEAPAPPADDGPALDEAGEPVDEP